MVEREDEIMFLPIEEIIRHEIWKLYKNVEIEICSFIQNYQKWRF